ncbi:MAG: lamin tail domain-containing protein [Polyangiaceae bacterium]
MTFPRYPSLLLLLFTVWACATGSKSDTDGDNQGGTDANSSASSTGGAGSAAASTVSSTSTGSSTGGTGGTSGAGAGSTGSAGGSGGATSSSSSASTTGAGGAGGGSTIAVGDLVITELMNNPSAVTDANGEWFEIYNPGMMTVNMKGLVIRHQDPMKDPTAISSIASDVFVSAKSYVVLGLNGNTATNGGVTVHYVYASAVNLNNTADYLAIETTDTPPLIIDATTYDQLSGLDPKGKSRNLNPLFLTAMDNNDDTHFCEATSVIVGSTDLGTPGAPNDPCN